MTSLRELVTDYLEELEIAGRASITAKRYGAHLQLFLRWLQAIGGTTDLSLNAITLERLRQYRLYLARRRDSRTGLSISASTRNLHLIALRGLLRYARKRKLDAPDPDEALELAKTRDTEIRHLERDEVQRIATAVRLDLPHGLRDRAIIEALFGTGCRVSELVAMTRRQINLDRREAEVVGKGGRSRLVLLTVEAATWIRRYLESRSDDAPYLFLSRQRDIEGQQSSLKVRQVQRIVERAAERAGMPFRVSPHWYRHSRLSVLARWSGVQVAQRIAGHASLQTTARYLHVSDQHLRRAFDDAEQADRGR